MQLDRQSLRQLIEAARGKRKADMCFRGCRLVNVLSGLIEEVDLAVYQGRILGWGEYDAAVNFEMHGQYIAPGFIDGHIHIESTLLRPANFCDAVVPWGTSCVVADPHEIANVLGLEGIRYFLQETEGLPLDIYFNLPSCVPASPLETSGAHLLASDLQTLSPHPRLLGLAEMMNFPGVLESVPEVLDKLLPFQADIIDGHAPGLSGMGLNGYIAAGIRTDHECTVIEEAQEKLSKGMAVMIREGSQSKDLEQLLPLVNDRTWPHCLFVSDDRHPDDLSGEGHMNAIVNRAISLGMDPVRAITLATWTPANHYRLMHIGALAPGYQADFSISPTLSPWNPARVFKRGIEVARNGELLIDTTQRSTRSSPQSPMHIHAINEKDLAVPAQQGKLRVIGVREGTLLTEHLLLTPRIEEGFVRADPERDILKLVIFNRYIPNRPPAIGFVKGIGLDIGAIASTVSHDSHNLIAVGTNDTDILHVVRAVVSEGGGLAIGRADSLTDVLPLPVAGLMSDRPIKEVVERLRRLLTRAKSWGSPLHNPFMALSFLALPVIPELKLTDLGLVQTSTFSFVSLFE